MRATAQPLSIPTAGAKAKLTAPLHAWTRPLTRAESEADYESDCPAFVVSCNPTNDPDATSFKVGGHRDYRDAPRIARRGNPYYRCAGRANVFEPRAC